MAEEKEEKKEEDAVKIVEVATQFGKAYELPDKTVVDFDGLILWIANRVWEINKAL